MKKAEMEALKVGDKLVFKETGLSQTVVAFLESGGKRVAVLTKVALIFIRDLLKLDVEREEVEDGKG